MVDFNKQMLNLNLWKWAMTFTYHVMKLLRHCWLMTMIGKQSRIDSSRMKSECVWFGGRQSVRGSKTPGEVIALVRIENAIGGNVSARIFVESERLCVNSFLGDNGSYIVRATGTVPSILIEKSN